MKRVLENIAVTGARWFGWCAGIVGLCAASGASCPCCGRGACPVGVAGSGVVGACAATLMGKIRRKNEQLHDVRVVDAVNIQNPERE